MLIPSNRAAAALLKFIFFSALAIVQRSMSCRLRSSGASNPPAACSRGGKIGDRDLCAGRDHMRVFHHVGQLADIARPAVFLQQPNRLRRQLLVRFAVTDRPES